MRALWPTVNRWLIWFHRWAGVAFCLLVSSWFVSGAILHFVPYPSLERSDQLAHSEPLDLSRILIDPATAFSRIPNVIDLRLISVAGRPTYVGGTAKNTSIRVAADTGDVLPSLAADNARVVAERFAGSPVASVAGPLAYDQWIVHQRFDRYRPLFRVRMNDPDRTDLYVSAVTGEVVQRTRFAERAWNWPGAILHWLYFTPLRENWPVWNQTVWWLSLLTVLSSAAGIWLGILRLIANRAAGRPGLSPFSGWMRWHHTIGLFAGVIVFGWIFSGWLSMDHGRMFSQGLPTKEQVSRVYRVTLSSAVLAVSLKSIRGAGPAKEISVHAIAGRPFLAVRSGNAAGSHIVWLDGGARTPTVPQQLLLTGLRAAWSDAAPAYDRFDGMYRLAEHLPPTARGFVAPRSDSVWIYVDPLSAEIVTVMDPSRRTYAWIYYALHTLNFPGLMSRPFTRTAIELLLLAGGFAFGTTGIVLAVRRLRQELAH
jgi:uncharacterized iron-regulated membrane protein